MKFKVGDKVKIKDNLKEIEGFECGYSPNLEAHVGKICTIKEFIREGKAVKVKENRWSWDIRAIEKIKCTFTKSDLQDGDIVTYRNGWKRTFKKDMLINEDGHNSRSLSSYKENLTDEDNDYKDLDIVKVERPTRIQNSI